MDRHLQCCRSMSVEIYFARLPATDASAFDCAGNQLLSTYTGSRWVLSQKSVTAVFDDGVGRGEVIRLSGAFALWLRHSRLTSPLHGNLSFSAL